MRGGLPRAIEVVLAASALFALVPLFAIVAISIAAGSGVPVIFRQVRVGLGGAPFTLYKFRTMRVETDGPGVTARDDLRITRIGRWLRRTKIDELPELWNIFRGDMSFVGPRPELPRYVDATELRWQQVLSARPGLTDPTTLAFIDEEALLASFIGDREVFYRHELLPRKLDGYVEYLNRRTWRSDIRVLLMTLAAILQTRRHH